MGARIVVLGSSFAGLAAAVELKKQLGEAHEVVVISPEEEFVFLPSLIWVPFGLRKREDISFPLRPVFSKRGIVFRQTTATALDLENKRVRTADGDERYDYLVIATGSRPDFSAVPGLGPQTGFTQSIDGWQHASHALVEFEKFLQEPGPVVIGAAPGASFLPAVYEFAFNLTHQLHEKGPKAWQRVSFVTPEPYLGHLGMGSIGAALEVVQTMFHRFQIDSQTNAAIKEVRPGELELASGQVYKFKYAMIAAPQVGADVVRARKDITDASGFVQVNESYHVATRPEVYAAGVAISIPPAKDTEVPVGFPKSGYLSEETARLVAHNIAADIGGKPKTAIAPTSLDAKWILDAGSTGIIMSADHQTGTREHEALFPGPHAHWAKIALEKYFLATHRRGLVP